MAINAGEVNATLRLIYLSDLREQLTADLASAQEGLDNLQAKLGTPQTSQFFVETKRELRNVSQEMNSLVMQLGGVGPNGIPTAFENMGKSASTAASLTRAEFNALSKNLQANLAPAIAKGTLVITEGLGQVEVQTIKTSKMMKQLGLESTEAGGRFEGMAERMLFRMALLYALKGSFDFVKGIFEGADALVKLSDASGNSVEMLLALQHRAETLDIPFTKVTSAIDTFEKNLSKMSPAVSNALGVLGLSFEKLNAENPDQRLRDIGEAYSKLNDPLTKVSVAAALGLDGIKSLIPEFGVLADASGSANAKMEADTQRHLSMVAGYYKTFFDGVKGATASFIDSASEVFAKADLWVAFKSHNITLDQYKDSLSALLGPQKALRKELNDGLITTQEYVTKLHEQSTLQLEQANIVKTVTTHADIYNQILKEQLAQTKALDPVLKDELNTLKMLGPVTEEQAIKLGATVAQYRNWMKASEEAAAALKKQQKDFEDMKKIYEDLANAGDGWKGTLDSINGSVAESVKYYLQAGVSQESLAKVYGLTADQVRAVAKALSEEDAALKKEQSAILKTVELWDAYYAHTLSQGATATEAKIAQVDKWYNDTVAKMEKAGGADANWWNALNAEYGARLNEISVDFSKLNSELTTNSKQGLQEIADRAVATYQVAINSGKPFTDAFLQSLKAEADAAQQAADSWNGVLVPAIDKAKSHTDAVTESARALSFQMQSVAISAEQAAKQEDILIQSFKNAGMPLGNYLLSSNPPARAEGGDVAGGQPYLVGEGGPELMVPKSSGTIIPNKGLNSGGGSPSITVNVNVSGSMLGTKEELAKTIGVVLVTQMRRSGMRLPVGV